eukprot:TRINITY_DN21635_c0_g1_i1.p1 TRINITY_DN21635_c0_g1~~TRINITY_DN21635_c0_g1_i1.p1  ORF type:complete len:386 (+),score=88.47 TRINITY_DN21635_c0_g1_i1:36-1160(+)
MEPLPPAAALVGQPGEDAAHPTAAPVMGAGDLLTCSTAEILERIEADMLIGQRAAEEGFRLHDGCELGEELRLYCEEVLASTGKLAKDWRCLMNKRIGISYKQKCEGLVWLDDKLLQVAAVAKLCGDRELHLPILGSAAVGDSTALEQLQEEVRRCRAAGRGFVVKPRHGSNTKHVHLWTNPLEHSEEDILKSIDYALCSEDPSWRKESWNQNAVPKGVIVQPVYRLMTDCCEATLPAAGSKLNQPLELKVQVLFGEVVGACLNTHPSILWVSRDGFVHQWDVATPGLLKKGHGIIEALPEPVLAVLQHEIRAHWRFICENSERIAQGAMLDEIIANSAGALALRCSSRQTACTANKATPFEHPLSGGGWRSVC